MVYIFLSLSFLLFGCYNGKKNVDSNVNIDTYKSSKENIVVNSNIENITTSDSIIEMVKDGVIVRTYYRPFIGKKEIIEEKSSTKSIENNKINDKKIEKIEQNVNNNKYPYIYCLPFIIIFLIFLLIKLKK